MVDGKSFVKNIIFYVIGVIFISVAFIGSAAFTIYRYVIGLYLSHKYQCPIKFVEGVDAVFCTDQEKNPYFTQLYHVFKGAADLELIRERIRRRWLEPHNYDGRWKHLKLRQELKFELGYYFWAPKRDFRFEEHVIEYDASHVKTKNEFHQLVEQLGSSVTLEKRILWQFILVHFPNGIPGLSAEPHFVLFYNHHHGLSDAMSAIRLHMLLFDDNFDTGFLPTRRSLTTVAEHCLHWTNVAVFGLYRFCRHLAVKPKLVSLGTGLTLERVFSISVPIPLEKVRKIKSKTGSTTNDVLTSCVLGAFNAHLVSEKRSISDMVKLNIPISLHDLKNEVRFENKVSFLSLLLAVDSSSPVDCLLRTKKGLDELKRSPEMYIVHYVAKYVINSVPKYLTLPFFKRFFTTAIVSSIPTPFSGTFFGNEYKQSVPLGTPNTISGCGICITMLLDKDTMIYAIRADTGVMKDQETLDRFVRFITEHFDNLYKATVEP